MSYVDDANKVIKKLYEDRRNKITTSQIRGLLSGMSDIYNDVVQLDEKELPKEILNRIEYLKVQFVYEAGRDDKVKKFLDEAKLIQMLNIIGNSKAKFKYAERYMEALVAYHRFYGGKDE